jgi:saccharopine dehydrogenase-like NADP-dependent oxidoreductase
VITPLDAETGKEVLILGGYGSIGRLLCKRLLQETDAQIVLAGRTIEKAETTAMEFNNKFEGRRVSAGYADATGRASLLQALSSVDLVVLASTTTQYAPQIAAAALEANIDFFDLLLSTKSKIAGLKK